MKIIKILNFVCQCDQIMKQMNSDFFLDHNTDFVMHIHHQSKYKSQSYLYQSFSLL